MNRANQHATTHGNRETPITDRINRYQVPIVVRMKYGEELDSIRRHEDGLSFHSSTPIPEGKVVELILCGGSILVDARIVECRPVLEELGGFEIRARYAQASQDMRELIDSEMERFAQQSA